MSYEHLVTQTVVASIEATANIRKRFMTFAKRLAERDEDCLFAIGERKCKIATGGGGCYEENDDGGCSGVLVIEFRSPTPETTRIGFKLSSVSRGGEARLTLTFNPSQLLAGEDIAPTLSGKGKSASKSPASSRYVSAKLLGLGFDVLDALCSELGDKQPLIDYGVPGRYADDDIQVERVTWDTYFGTESPSEFLLYLMLLFEPVFRASGGGRAFNLAGLLQLATKYDFDQRTGDLKSVTFTDVQGDRRKVYSIAFELLSSSASGEGENDQIAPSSGNNRLRLRVTAHPTGLDQLIREGRRIELYREREASDNAESTREGWDNGDADAGSCGEDEEDEDARNLRSVWAMSKAIEALGAAPADSRQNHGSFPLWLVTKMLRDTLFLDVVSAFDQKNVDTVAALSRPPAQAWASGDVEPMDIKALAEAGGVSVEAARKFRKAVREKYGIDVGVPRAFYSGASVAAVGAMSRDALNALACALGNSDSTKAGELFVEAASRFVVEREKVIAAPVANALAGRLGEFAVEEVDDTVNVLGRRRVQATGKTAAASKTQRTTRQPSPKEASKKASSTKPRRERARGPSPSAPKGRRRNDARKARRRTPR